MALASLAKKIFGTRNDRILRNYGRSVKQINALEAEFEALSDEQLRGKTKEFKGRLTAGETLDDLLVEAFAAVREAAKRTLGMRHFDVQLIGGMVLHQGKIAEMRTGEGKTLTSTLASYLHALAGKGVHLVTVNDYLAQRDAKDMEPVFNALDMTVGVNLSNMAPTLKKEAYDADITYGTNNEFGFDYLRDNMVFELDQRVQRELNYAIIDEVDSILIDEARTPLIISGEAEQTETYYKQVNAIIPHLERQEMGEDQKEDDIPEEDKRDFTLDEKSQQAFLTEKGHVKVEGLLLKAGLMQEGESLYDYKNIGLMHFVYAALKANSLYQRDVHYVVKNGEIIIVDEHTGRLMEGRRWSDGLHQAVEAKEGVKIQMENQTMATITFQNFFRMYGRLSGMTGTADTEAFELQKIYGLEVVVVPTNKPMVRKDHSDKVYLNEQGKYKAVIEKIKEIHATKQPVLVGTASIEASELVAKLLAKEKIPHNVLNAKQHEREANIITEAGRLGAVTIATNMAGRGTDIVLGGNFNAVLTEHDEPSEELVETLRNEWQQQHDEVVRLGGLCVLATERHESRRIDNQLRGRSGRQGDPGCSYFYLSMEDNLMRIFASDRVKAMMQRFGFTEDDVIENKMITGAIEKAQRRVENYNYDMRKNLLEYDDVANDQRGVVYDERLKLLELDDVSKSVVALREDAIQYLLTQHIDENSMEEDWDLDGLEKQLKEDFNVAVDVRGWLDEQAENDLDAMQAFIVGQIKAQYVEKVTAMGEETQRQLEKGILLQTLDHHWKEHLAAMDHLRKGIHLRSYAQKNPTQEYKKESFNMFENMLDVIGYEAVALLSRVELQSPDELQMPTPEPTNITYIHQDASMQTEDEIGETESDAVQPYTRDGRKVGRNELCPCGSGKKFKQCHGKLDG
jgi:preprotein translocase subunit SecA